MPPEIIALIDKPHLLIAVLLIGGFVGMAVERLTAKLRRRAWRKTNPRRYKARTTRPTATEPRQSSSYQVPTPPLDAAEQLRIVMAADFTAQPLLNKSESRVFKELDRLVITRNPSWQVMAQVSLGEILGSKDPDAYRCINSKRVDLLLMDGGCKPRHVIEYQGGAHHQGTAAARDAVKKEALRRAGIGYHEVVAGHTTPSDLRRLVEKLVDRPNV
jgi:hypothetical protein